MLDRLKKVFIHEKSHNEAILNLLEKTTIGTNGARYQHLHTREKINALHCPHFFTIYRNNKAISNITFCERPMYVNSQLIDSLYVRYFAFDSIFQSKGKIERKNKESIFQNYVKALFETSNLDVYKPERKPMIYWAIIDPENVRSWQMADKYKFETIAKIKTIAFSRFYPKQNPNVHQLNKNEQEEVWQYIKSFYSKYTNLTKVHLFKEKNYFVYKKDGKILAGIQANPISWRIEALPGLKGKILVKILPYIPFINKLINPKSYHFLATEGLFWLPGHEDKIKPLLESVLSIQNCNSMLIWLDSRDANIYQHLKASGFGLLQKLKNDNEVEILAKFNSIPESLKSTMKNSLQYVSGFDAT